MQRRLGDELRALRFDGSDDALPRRSGKIGYSSSIQRVVAATTTNASLVFPSSGSSGGSGSSAASSASLLSSVGSHASVSTPGSGGSQSYMLLRVEAFRDLSEIATHMVNDGYTEGLITEFAESGGDAILRTWFSELGVDWVLGVDENRSQLMTMPWSAVEELIKRWVVAFTVMAEALRLTRPELSSGDVGSGSGERGLGARVSSAPAGQALLSPASAAASPGSSDLDQESSDPATRRSFDVAFVKDAILAYSAAENGRFFTSGGLQEAKPDFQFLLFAEASLMRMMRFPEVVAQLHRSPEHILRMIDMYSLLSDTAPCLLALLSGGSKSMNLVSDKIATVLQALSDAVRHILRKLLSLIQAEDSWRANVNNNNDDVHPVTLYVLNYINLLLKNGTVLDLMLLQPDDQECIILFASDDDSSLAGTVRELISSVDAMVEEKSKAHATAGRRYVFLLNNAYFILQQAEAALQDFLGAWSGHREGQIDRHIKGYLDASWGPVVSCLHPHPGRRKSVFRKVSDLVEFNALLEMTYHTEKSWKVRSPQLRARLRKAVSTKVVAAYRAYLEAHALSDTTASVASTHTPEELQELLQGLFEG